MLDIKKNVKALIREMGLTQDVVAGRMHVTQGTFSAYFNHNKDIKFGKLLEISKAMNIDVVDIISYPDKLVKQVDGCPQCREKDAIIRNLNDYINVIKRQIRTTN